MPRFRINQGYGRHALRPLAKDQPLRIYRPGDEIELDRYDPNWHGKFEPLDSQASDLRRCAQILGRKVRVQDLPQALLDVAAADRSAYRDLALGTNEQPEALGEHPLRDAAVARTLTPPAQAQAPAPAAPAPASTMVHAKPPLPKPPLPAPRPRGRRNCRV